MKENNITSKNGIVAKVGDTIRLFLLDEHQHPQPRRALLLAVNAEQERDNGRYVLESNLHALPVCTLNEVEIVAQSEQHEKAFKPPTDASGLRLDGPTVEEFLLAGYKLADYPPTGFAEILSDEERAIVKAALSEHRTKKFSEPEPPSLPASELSSSPELEAVRPQSAPPTEEKTVAPPSTEA